MKKKILLKFLVATVVAATGILGSSQIKTTAAPIEDAQIKLTQPNGQVVDCLASGDEFYNFIHDSKGRAIVKDEKTGYYVYGKYVNDKVIASRERVTKGNIETLQNIENDSRVNMNEVKFPEDEVQKQKELFESVQAAQGATKNIGTLNNIVIFIKFSDQYDISRGFSTYNKLFNGQNQASLNNFYKEVSYDKLNVNTTFYPKPQGEKVLSYVDNHPRSYYSNVPSNERGNREQTLLANAINSVKSQIPKDLNIDSDNDGKVDNICFIIKGGTNEWSSLLWPHMWSMFAQHPEINGKQVGTYNFQLEDYMGNDGVGVLCHEMGHTLGAPDLYRYNSQNSVTPVGQWDVMATSGNVRPSTSTYMKMRYGKWINNINEITNPGRYSVNSIKSSSNNSYIIRSPKSKSEYFVVEYRKKEGSYETKLPGQGLLVYRINGAYAGRGNASSTSTAQDEIYLYRPSGTLSNNGYLNNAALGSSKTSISSSELFLSNGADSGISLKNINISNDTANFDVVIDGKEGNEDLYKGKNFNFTFKGYSDKQFAKLDLNLENFTSKLTIENIKTHYYFNDSYASILVQDNNGKTVFSKDFVGNEINDALVKDIPLKEGYYLTVKHRESAGRLFITNVDKNLSVNKGDVNRYKINKNELKPISENEIPDPNKNPYAGKNFDFNFKGLGDWLFAELNLDLTSNQAKIDLKKGAPHVYFTDSYASILIRDNEGNDVYTKDFIGNKTYEALVNNINVKPGYFITIKHKESNGRLQITNLNNKLALGIANSINYKITDDGLTNVSDSEIPKPTKATYYGSNFNTIFKGYADRTFAEMKMDLTKKQATVITNAGVPHRYFNEYATITVKNSKNEIVYTKKFIGTNNYGSNNEVVSLEEGSTVTITHLESKGRLQIINTTNGSELQKANSVSYQVVNGGLKKTS